MKETFHYPNTIKWLPHYVQIRKKASIKLSKMKKVSSPISYTEKISLLVIAISCLRISTGDPRIQTVRISSEEFNCLLQCGISSEEFNSVSQKSGDNNVEPGLKFSCLHQLRLPQCYGDLSSLDCVLCYAQAWTARPKYFPWQGVIYTRMVTMNELRVTTSRNKTRNEAHSLMQRCRRWQMPK